MIGCFCRKVNLSYFIVWETCKCLLLISYLCSYMPKMQLLNIGMSVLQLVQIGCLQRQLVVEFCQQLPGQIIVTTKAKDNILSSWVDAGL